MGWTARIAIAVAVLLILGGIGLAVYGGMLQPPHQAYQVVLSNDRFPS
ncbi:MAG TPA: hypothetical protein VHW02_03410 [Rhizomicrobium sp.]|jgi:hypothetical protein|nr:hypothetical protein [Rhizomicrobium sp.]